MKSRLISLISNEWSDQTIETIQIFSKDDLKREAKNTLTNLWRKECHLLRENKLTEYGNKTYHE